MKSIPGQMDLFEYTKAAESPKWSCDCICKNCLYWWSARCPYGRCFDNKRAIEDPFDKRFPDKTPRTTWSNWNKPNEQKHWCRGGIFYPVNYCEKFVKYNGQEIQECIACNIAVFQDGYISCSVKNVMSCEDCIEEQEGRAREQIYGCRYMTENGCASHINALSLRMDNILEGSGDEMCKEQCCIGCTKVCGFRCGQC